VRAISDDGNRLVYNTKGGLPGSTNSSPFVPVLAEYANGSWQSKMITPTQAVAPAKSWQYILSDASLDHVLGLSLGYPNGPASERLWRLSPSAPELSFAGRVRGAAGSEDGSTTVAVSGQAVDPRFPSIDRLNLYYASSEGPRLIDLLPGGEVPACGINTGSQSLTGAVFSYPELANGPNVQEHWVSPDGRLAFFPSEGNTCNGRSQIYARDLVTETTRRVSPPSVAGAQECSAAFIKYTAGSVYFASEGKLLQAVPGNAECGEGGAHMNIFRFDLATETLSCLTCLKPGQSTEVKLSVGNPYGLQTEIAVSPDGSRVYFASNRELVAGAAAPGFYRLAPDTGDLHYIGAAQGSAIGASPTNRDAMSADGSSIVFLSTSLSLNPVGGLTNGGTLQYYVYDDRNQSLTCASCPQDGAPPAEGVEIALRPTGSSGLITATEGQSGANLTPISADGRVLAFMTTTSLVPQDVNATPKAHTPGGSDVYEWNDGAVRLVSDGVSNWENRDAEIGTGANPAAPKVAGVSRDGQRVFFTVSADLTGSADDTFNRLYDARAGSPSSAQAPGVPSGCPPEGCSLQGTAPGGNPAPGSSSFSGPGNPQRKSHKGGHRKKHRKKKHGEKKKHGKPQRHRGVDSGSTKGGGR
jgi:Tol biopolymer transport system component